jgi:hypothetical protein
MEMIWRPYGDNYIYSSVTYNGYEAPTGFNFDLRFTDDPIMSNKRMEYYNLDKKSD